MKNELYDGYLTESKLGEVLKILFPNVVFTHDKIVPNSGIKNRPDYRSDKLMLIVEFDGYRHFTSPKLIFADRLKDETYGDMGYIVMRIPYFVQLDKEMIYLLFGVTDSLVSSYEHGFIDSKAMLPAEFSELGTDRFIEEYKSLPYKVCMDILTSLKYKIDYLENRYLVANDTIYEMIS